MTYKQIFIIVFVIVAAFYVFKVKGFNPFVSKIKSNIVLYTLDGKTTPLDECVGENGTFIFIMGTWCPYCSKEVEQLKTLNDFFKSHKINILIGMKGQTYEEIQSWVLRHDFPWNWKAFYWYKDYEKDFHIKIKGVPYLAIRNKKGKTTFKKAGVFQSDHLSKLALNLLKNDK